MKVTNGETHFSRRFNVDRKDDSAARSDDDHVSGKIWLSDTDEPRRVWLWLIEVDGGEDEWAAVMHPAGPLLRNLSHPGSSAANVDDIKAWSEFAFSRDGAGWLVNFGFTFRAREILYGDDADKRCYRTWATVESARGTVHVKGDQLFAL
jgi:hypothetical protein